MRALGQRQRLRWVILGVQAGDGKRHSHELDLLAGIQTGGMQKKELEKNRGKK